jgi:hypothetical protein
VLDILENHWDGAYGLSRPPPAIAQCALAVTHEGAVRSAQRD